MYQTAKFNIQFNIGRSLNQIKVVECERYMRIKNSVIFILLALRFVYIGAKATSLPDGLVENPI